MTLDQRLIQTVPSARQIAYQQTEFYAFIHFNMNTYTDREWGNGREEESLFNPVDFDAEQWVENLEKAHMKGLILTCKHHDGFCLWPSKYTDHSVASSPYKDGKGDIVREVADACHRHGIKFGVYLSPWDMNSKHYGHGAEYDDYFCNQLTELLTGYGDVFSVWFDGACGEGENGKKQYYDWDRYYKVIRQLQPGACINVCGPDVRWCGNEAGYTRPAEWSVVPKRTQDTEKIQSMSQQADDTEFRERRIFAWDQDLGSRQIMANESEYIWYPAEVNTSIRPGWFYHTYEDEKVRTLDDLMHVYNCSVGANATFLLNIPPMPNGLFHENDCKRLAEIGEYLDRTFAHNILDTAEISCPDALEGYGAENVRVDSYGSYFTTPEGVTQCELTISFREPTSVGNIVLKENITKSQRVESFEIYSELNGIREAQFAGTVIGHKRIVPIQNILADKIIIKITDSRVSPTLSFVGVYKSAK